MNPAIASVTLFAVIVTKLTDLVRNTADPNDAAPAWLWQALAGAIGVGIAFIWEVNALEVISHTPAQGATGTFITGLGMSAAGSGWHELFDAVGSISKSNDPDKLERRRRRRKR